MAIDVIILSEALFASRPLPKRIYAGPETWLTSFSTAIASCGSAGENTRILGSARMIAISSVA